MCSVEKCGKFYLISLNSLMLITGLALIGLSIWMGVSTPNSEIITPVFVWVPVGCGMAAIFVGLLGCCGAIFENRISLCFYVCVCTLLLLSTLVLASFVLVEIGYVEDAADTYNSAGITNPSVDEVNTFEAVMFNRCCHDAGWGIYKVKECPGCPNATDKGCMCYNDRLAYAYHFSEFDTEFCNVMTDMHVAYSSDGSNEGTIVPLVGSPTEGGCGYGDPKEFQKVVAIYAKEQLSPGAWAIILTSLVMLIGVILACVILCKKKSTEDTGYGQAEDDKLEKEIDLEDDGVELTEPSPGSITFT